MADWWQWLILGIVICLALAASTISFRINFGFILDIFYDVTQAMRSRAQTHAATDSVKPGVLAFNVPSKMVQGTKERAEVRIARSADLQDEVLADFHGSGEPELEAIDTSLYMEVRLAGSAFDVTSHSPAEQLIIPTPAHWEFDVLPRRAGQRALTLYVTMRIEAPGIVAGRRGVSVLEKQIDVQVNMRYATRHFMANNYQWLIPTLIALAAATAAWLAVPF